MSKNPDYLLSIIIPTYNDAEFIRSMLASILVGLTAEVEIIIINDGSTDGTDKEIITFCQNISPLQIKYIQQENYGISAARNIGLANATGKYIAFVDADDLISADYYDILLPLLREEAYDLVEFNLTRDQDCLYCNKKNHPGNIKKEEIIISDDDFSALTPIFQASQWHLVNKIFHRSIISDERFEHNRNYEDLILVPFQYFKCHRILKIDVTLYYYRVNPASITENIREEDADDIFFAMKKMNHFIKEKKHFRTLGTYMMVNCFLEGRKIIRKKKGFYIYNNKVKEDIQSVLSYGDIRVINHKILKKMQHLKLDEFISKLNYQLLKIIKNR